MKRLAWIFFILSLKEDIKHETWCDFGQFDVLLILLNSRSVVVGRDNGVYFITNNALLRFQEVMTESCHFPTISDSSIPPSLLLSAFLLSLHM